MSTVGVILSTVGDVQYRGRYHDARGDIMSSVEVVLYRGGKIILLFEYPIVLNTPTILMISPTCIMISPTVLKFQRMVSPTVLNTPHGTHVNTRNECSLLKTSSVALEMKMP